MREKRFLVLFFVWVAFISCSPQVKHQKLGQLTVIDGELMMVGEVQYADILDQFPEWRAAHEEAETNEQVIAEIQEIKMPLDIQCFIGTWCSDSRYETPPFMKTLSLAKNPNINIELIGVDRQKDDPHHLGPENDIDRVPTFIVKREGVESFRMIEFPDETFAKDLLRELAKIKG